MARAPLRSPLVGTLLMAVALATTPVLCYLYFAWGLSGMPAVVAFVLQFPLYVLGYRLRRRDAAGVLADPSRSPILYLRPFRQEAVASPGNQEWDSFKTWLLNEERLLLPLVVLVLMAAVLVFIGQGALVSVLLLVGTALGIAYAVFVLYRRLRRLNRVSLEQELCHHLGHAGPFVAVGDPRDWFAPAGAARVYLDDDAWQAAVTDYVRRARLIVVHLVPDGWTWWEFCLCARESSPRRLLAIVVGASLSDAEYERLRRQLASGWGIALREQRGKLDLLTFDRGWTVRYVNIELIARVWWPFRAFKIRRSTFEAVLKGDSPGAGGIPPSAQGS